ncbi:MAG: hypothetical protein JWP00_4613 [Chloroflexi bacterium]|nr:hypothetical protein [Chloroflexota bacterium]
MNSEENKPAGLTASDSDIDRLFEYKLKQTPGPGSVVDRTLAELRQQHLLNNYQKSKFQTWQNRGTKFVVASLGIAAALALVFVTLAVLVSPSKETPGIAGQVNRTNQITATTPTALPVATAATGSITSQPAINTGTATAMSPQTPANNNQETSASAGTTGSNSTSANPTDTSSIQQASSPPASVPAMIANPTRAGAIGTTQSEIMISGTIISLDVSTRVIIISDDAKKSIIIKLLPGAIINNMGIPVQFSDLKVGDILTATGAKNNQNQFEANSIVLGIEKNTRPIGEPGYPDGTK